jgi:hypothetical protein
LHGGIEENLEGPQDIWLPAQGLKEAPTEYKSRSSHCTDSVGIQHEYIWGFFKKQNLMKLQYMYAHLNKASILLNAVVAVSKLSHMPCFVQTAFAG